MKVIMLYVKKVQLIVLKHLLMNHLCAENLIIETTGEELEHLSEDQLVDLINKYKRGLCTRQIS